MNFLEQIIALIIIINPFAAISLYIALTDKYSDLRHKIVIWRIVKKMFLILLAFLLIGSLVLKFYGLSIDEIRIAGGFLLFFSSWKTINKKEEHEKIIKNSKEDISFFPMAMPMLAGPSAISYIIQLNTTGNLMDWLFILKMVGVLVVCSAITYVILYSFKWIKKIGNGILMAMSKLMSFFMLALAIKMIIIGILNIFK